MIRKPERWDELQAGCRYRLQPVRDMEEAANVRRYLRDRGHPIDHDAPVGVCDSLLMYAVMAGKEVVYAAR